MNFFIENMEVIIIVIALLVTGGASVWSFLMKPSAEQLAKIGQWLLWAVSDAERYLGGGTGQLKLSMVYDKFLKSFPWLSRIITIAQFSDLVDIALDKMRNMIENNMKVAEVVENKDVGE